MSRLEGGLLLASIAAFLAVLEVPASRRQPTKEREDGEVSAIHADCRIAELDATTTALLEFATKLTNSPQRTAASDVAALLAAGFANEAIVDAAQLIGYFNLSNRLVDSLEIEPEPEMRFGPVR